MKIEPKLFEILQQNPYRTYRSKELARLLNIPTYQYKDFRRTLKRLIADGKINRYRKNRLGVGIKTREVIGRLHVKSQGYGFLIQEGSDEDVFIDHLNLRTAFHGDLVKVLLFAEKKGKSLEGKVIEVIERARRNIVGTYKASKHWGIVVADNIKMQRDIYIPPEKSKGAETGQKVVVRIDEWEDERLNPEGTVVEVLGFPNEIGIDILSIAKSFDLETTFKNDVLAACKRFPDAIPENEIQKRLDLRNELIFTIDPEDSKDFDDAVSVSILENGHYKLGVHIADVSYYVRSNTAIDNEAMQRGTSVYLVDRVIPMLPEKLSNNLCSLREGEDRLCFSVLMEISPEGELLEYRITESVINSKKRFTYEQVQQIIEKGTRKKDELSKTIAQMYNLSRLLIAKREVRGGLDFGTNEVKIILNENGVPVRIVREVNSESHRVIEEFMVLANQTVASHVSSMSAENADDKLPFAYRVHEKPGSEKLKSFNLFLQALGMDVQLKKRVTPKMFQNILNQIDDPDKRALVQQVMVRAMMKAKYDIQNIGHFGLALTHYCHFTSPIRRYPDLICHRLLKAYLGYPDESMLPKKKIVKICEIANTKEIAAQDAERASIKAKQLEFMEQFIGDIFPGIISGVVAFGFFVEITEYLVEGLVHITQLPDDYYIHDEARFSLYGRYHGKEYRLGDHVNVRVSKVNRDAQLIDFDLAES